MDEMLEVREQSQWMYDGNLDTLNVQGNEVVMERSSEGR